MTEEYFKAIMDGDIARVEQMIEHNPSLLNSKTESGMSGVTLATYYGQPKISELLIRKGALLDLFEASMVGSLDATKRLLESDRKLVNLYSNDGFTALHLAAFFGHLQVARFLIEQGADVDAATKNRMRVTPIHSAVARNQLEISELLIAKGADVNARQENDFTPIHASAQNGNVELTKLLLKHGARVNARTLDDKTPLRMTEQEGRESGKKEDREQVAKILVQNGGIK